MCSRRKFRLTAFQMREVRKSKLANISMKSRKNLNYFIGYQFMKKTVQTYNATVPL